jgi:hypothetical protein
MKCLAITTYIINHIRPNVELLWNESEIHLCRKPLLGAYTWPNLTQKNEFVGKTQKPVFSAYAHNYMQLLRMLQVHGQKL